MSVETDTRDRVIRLETELAHLRASLEDYFERQEERDKKLEEVHGVVAKAKGIGYFGLAMIPVAGAIGGFLTWLGIKINVTV